MTPRLIALALWAPLAVLAQGLVEPLHRLAPLAVQVGEPLPAPRVALTLDACGGAFDARLIDLLLQHRVPATLFVTRRWLTQNPAGAALLRGHPDLFEIEDHGNAHLPSTLSPGRRVYGLAGTGSATRLQEEVQVGAQAIQALTGRQPRHYRGATAKYEPAALAAIEGMGYRVTGFSVNADAGATLPKAAIVSRLNKLVANDVIIAHMNKPASATSAAFAEALPGLLARGFRFVKLSEASLQPL
jgi:peptidoglycan/xylan/chitin deacetylase (PgdA/CDA1 family)